MITIDRTEVKKRCERIRHEIGDLCETVGRDSDSIDLIAVTKGFPPEVFEFASELDFEDVGENRVQKGVSRKEELGDLAAEFRWHMIGHVQSNKVKYLLDQFALIHSLDRESLLEELQKRLERNDLDQSVLLQVNLSGESAKHGVPPDRAEELLGKALEADRLSVEGLMTMAPFTDDETILRDTFASCRKLRNKLEESFDVTLPELSMGMTNDYPQAIREGSTMLRIGRGLFGERPD